MAKKLVKRYECLGCGERVVSLGAHRRWHCKTKKKLPRSPLHPKAKMETIHHPAHYGGANNLYEAIKVIEAWKLDFCLGNAVKYISRAGKKDDPLEDLKKALWYLDRRIQQIEQVVSSDTFGKRALEAGGQLDPDADHRNRGLWRGVLGPRK